jgi:MraZ protein
MVVELGRFAGEFEHKVDSKGRIPIPPKFRSGLKDGMVLTPGVEKYIIVYSRSEWEKVTAALTSGTADSSVLRRINRALFATAFNLKFDSQGRITLPSSLRKYAGIKDQVVVAGANTYLELWNRQAWETEKTASREQARLMMENLETVR